MRWDIHNRRVVVTGAASGIGQATCCAFADAGCDVVAVDVDEIGLATTRGLVRERGREANTFRVDVSKEGEMMQLARDVADRGGCDILVNNAGVTVISTFADHSLEDFRWLLGVNLWGVVHGCKAFLPQLSARRRSHIVNVSSIYGIIGAKGQSSYCASKFAVRGLSESLRLELADSGVGVTCVHPGGIRTSIVANARASGQQYEDARAQAMRWFESNAADPASVARAMVRAVRGNRARVVTTRAALALDAAQRLWPSGLQRAMRWHNRSRD